MKKLLRLFLLLSIYNPAPVSMLFAQNVEQTYRNPVISGDFPDPTLIRAGEDYYAAGTSSDFAPNYPVYHSRDLINWERIGAIFNETPEWIKGDCWAPELFYNNGTYFAYYTAKRKGDNISCIGVATTNDITKGFEDHGILIEWGKEAIDAFVFKDEDGQLYITWKAYGLDNSRPVEILCSELSEDGLSLVGKHFSLTNHQKAWVGDGEEGQCLVKHKDYYYLFYSVGGCCDNKCNYRVHVARAKSLKGDWEQYGKNPVLYGGGLWKCSGHGTVVQSPDNRYFYLYHAYHAYDFEYIGRQGLLDELIWDEKTDWPYFRYGNIPSAQAEMPFENTIQKKDRWFYDNFRSLEKDCYWQWDMNLPQPQISKTDGVLSLTTPESGFSFRGINPLTGNYRMETLVANKGENLKGLCVYGNASNLLAWGMEGTNLTLYKYENNIKMKLFSQYMNTFNVYLKVESVNARFFRFYWSENREDWHSSQKSVEVIDGHFLPQWGKGIRAGLIVENKEEDYTGKFSYFSLENE
ncbi:MAG: glycoside hydrolase family 43 protein [Dysgonamonadaceae bacterium]|jgi:beta-xylosidase|nr:glycoside hydrolase family 43 protein [Dysgonamonadaceae bacterium]